MKIITVKRKNTFQFLTIDIFLHMVHFQKFLDFPCGPVVKNPSANAGHGLHPWSWKIPWVMEQLSSWLQLLSDVPRLLKPVCPKAQALQQETPPQCEAKRHAREQPRLSTRESLSNSEDPAQPKTNKYWKNSQICSLFFPPWINSGLLCQVPKIPNWNY